MRKHFLTIAFGLVLLLGACGGARPATTQNISMTDFTYSPNHFLVPAGQEITLNISNNGAVVHNFIIMKAGTVIGKDFDAADEANEYWKIEIQSGATATASFLAPAAPGEYLVVCGTAGHYIAGMIGTLEVVSQ